jgi:hypothetical protein
MEGEKGTELGIIGFVLAIISLFFGIFGIVPAVIGLILCVIQFKHKKTGFAVAGIIISILGIALSILFGLIVLLVLKQFSNITKEATSVRFFQELQAEVNKAKSMEVYDGQLEIFLSKEIRAVCIINFSKDITPATKPYYDQIVQYENEGNLFIIPPEDFSKPYYALEGIDLEKITQDRNPYCVPSSRDLIIKKEMADREVVII